MQSNRPTLSPTGLWVLLAGMLLPQIDFSIVNVALDAMGQSLQVAPFQLALTVTLYGLCFALGLALGGRLGDRYGRRCIFMLGIAGFGLTSLLCGMADSIEMLLFARALQGLMAALIVPQVLATIHVCLQGEKHTRAVGYYGAIGGLSFVAGQVLGGMLVSADIAGLGWRSVFLINLPLSLALLILVPRTLPETRSEHARHIDWSGTLLLAGFIFCLLLPLLLGQSTHALSLSLASLLLAALLFNQLWQVEQRKELHGQGPLLPPSLLDIPSLRLGLGVSILFFSCWSGFMFTLALTLQAGAGLSPQQSGNAFIALGLFYFIGAMLSGRIALRLSRTRLLLLGCAIQMSGLILLLFSLQASWPLPDIAILIPSTALIGFGQSFIVNSIYRTSLADVSAAQAGAASAVLNTVLQTAMGLGAAFMGSLYAQALRYTHQPLSAMQSILLLEFAVMLLVVLIVRGYRSRFCLAA